MSGDGQLDELIRDLEDTAARLRGGELDQDEAAQLVDRCAEVAGQLGNALEQAGRDEGQGQLL